MPTIAPWRRHTSKTRRELKNHTFLGFVRLQIMLASEAKIRDASLLPLS